jgi:diguanylate cyclase (GGDEF)-like protein
MLLHIPTLMLALLLGFALLTLELGVAQRRLHSRHELTLWLRGSWCFLVGFLALVARVVVPEVLSIVLGNGLLTLGMACYALALHRLLLDRPGPGWLIGVQPVLWVLLLLVSDWPQARRTALLSAVFVAILVPSVRVILRHGWQAERSLRTVAVTMGLAVLALLTRLVHALLHPEDYAEFLQASLGQGLTFLMAFMSLLGAGFAFVLAVFERVSLQMEVMATHDGLTGCFNRSTTDAMLEHALRRGQRDVQPVSFVLLDLDHFKQVNDRHGHRTGDAVLRGFAEVVRQRLRASDVFGRTGGEEFGLVLPDTDAAGAQHLVESVRAAVEAMQVTGPGDQPVRVTVSAGVAVALGDTAASGDRLYGRADQALYEAKRAGRNRVELYGLSTAQASLLPEA